MLTWAYPDFVVAALALGLILGLLVWHWRRGGRLAHLLGSRPRHRGWKALLRIVAGGLLLAAVLGPSLGVSQRPVRTAGKDVWLLVDVSRSMDATDVAPTRLLRAQAELQDLVAQFPADRLGLVVFGAEAVVQCPLTYDQAAVQTFIATLRTSLLPAGPTTLQAPLELLLSRLTVAPSTGSPAPPRATALVVVSDGEDFGENLEPTLRALGRTGARIYTVGVGTAAGAKIPKANGSFVVDGRGRAVQTRLREGPLLQLAAQTGGQYAELTNQQNGFGPLLRSLRAMQGTAEQVRTVAVADNRYRYPLAAALLLLALDVALTITTIRP
ncbi:VWA domain-containing protein [Hymenobacter negativus]|uniref:VWA domain-containing protein n=1 Tax=Hymenobacter negativus TaxID=2795026 RepID=A0ABS0Q292_9BACT|nr:MULTISPECIES: VWA domain-containing protein [Bacteria]MBH8556748.1 VWA domain-containing protein [Hymenobacter negativus]MBH8571264.1 VWA domain-containing protein [Hymenobacter negativus]MBR7211001.1 VWA domain-containing protein [Microvirga sp. STS02]